MSIVRAGQGKEKRKLMGEIVSASIHPLKTPETNKKYKGQQSEFGISTR